ncbi:MAG TPA: ATP-binding cassette domain-containing protein [Acidimicrobiales bacterium]|nr:ATP-binding cassette domain-containing protein [Acidimicrobiales bacterium]
MLETGDGVFANRLRRLVTASLLAATISTGALVTGALTGLGYGVLAAGLVLVHRASGVINFAHAEIGAVAAAVLAKLVVDAGVPFVVALPFALLLGALTGVLVEATVVRRLTRTSKVVVLVATIGVAQVLLVVRAAVPKVDQVSLFPTPLRETLVVAGFTLRSEHFIALALLPAAVVALALVLSRTPTGLAIRAVADDADVAALAGVSPRKVSLAVWAMAGALAALTAVVIAPLRGDQVGRLDAGALGAGLLLRALVAALAGRLQSLPLALAGGVLLGAVEGVLLFSGATPAVVESLVFAAVLVLVAIQPRGRLGGDAFSLGSVRRAVPHSLRGVAWVRRLPIAGWTAALVGALLLPVFASSPGSVFRLTVAVCLAIVGLSIVVLTGWAGQLSLGQFALAGVGAFLTAALTDRGVPFGAAVIEATIGGTLVALAVALPALRVRGLFLAVTTLAAAVAGREALFTSKAFVGGAGDATVTRGNWLGIDFAAPRTYYLLCLLVLVLATAAIGHLRHTGIARGVIAVKDDEARAAALGVSPLTAKLCAFGLAGALATLGGALYGGLAVTFGPQSFAVEDSFRVVALVVIGGAGSVAGAVLGAAYLLGVPALFGNTAIAVLMTSGLGVLVLLLYVPGGLASAVDAARAGVLDVLARRRRTEPADNGTEVANSEQSFQADVATTARSPGVKRRRFVAEGEPVLEAAGVSVAFGGRRALDGVDLVLHAGESLGLIGPNGAGKSTLLAVFGGDVRADAGEVRFCGRDLGDLSAHDRARRGMGRSFQNPRMFAELTVHETISVALEAAQRSELVPSLLALGPSRRLEASRSKTVREVIGELGLGRYVDTPIAALSTGTRRIVELGCLLALRPSVLLLDEPTAGLAQRETEAFAPLIARVRTELNAAMVLVEHDVPLVLSIVDRVQCLAEGRTIAVLPPGRVRRSRAVVDAYLGRIEVAIARSG